MEFQLSLHHMRNVKPKTHIMKTRLSIFAIVFLAAVISAFTGTLTITGKVTDSRGYPLPGVNVLAKGTSNGVVTDLNGDYKITVNDQVKILQFSFIGCTTTEEKIAGRTIINVRMTDDQMALQEIVVTGYSSKREMKSASYDMAAPSVSFTNSRGSFNRPRPVFNTEGYAAVNENGFKGVKNNPLSTFSIDVDNASYTNIRRFINNGQLPPADAVRIEEMINYFRYDYPEPEGQHPFSVYTELAVCPWNKKHQLLQVGLRGKNIDKSSLPPSNLVFLIDVRG